MTVFDTPRLRIRRYTMDDVAFMHVLMADERVYFWREQPITVEQAAEELESKIVAGDEVIGFWVVFDRQMLESGASEAAAFLGQVCTQPLKNSDEIEFGYAFTPKAWGKGYATEASRAYLAHIFANTELDRLAAIVLPDNAPSLGVAERLGFTALREGIYGSSQRPHRYFELTRAEHEAAVAAGE